MIKLYLQSFYLVLQFSRGGASSGGTSMGNAGFCSSGSRHTSTVKPSDSQEAAMLCDICSTKFTLFNRKVCLLFYHYSVDFDDSVDSVDLVDLVDSVDLVDTVDWSILWILTISQFLRPDRFELYCRICRFC